MIPLCCPQADVGPHDGLRVPDESDPPIVHFGDLVSDVIDFLFEYTLQTKVAGRNEFELSHVVPF